MAGRAAIRIVGYAVGMGVLAGEEASPAGRAEWASNEGVAERYTFSGNTVEIGRDGEGMASAVQFIPAQIIHQDDNDVRPSSLGARQSHGTKARKELSSRLHPGR